MPILEKIVVQDYRNITLQELTFSPNINCISGNNGEGKTNLLDAIWYLSMTKSAVSPSSDRYNFRFGTDAFAIAGSYRMENGTVSTFSVRSDASGQKRFVRDDKAYPKISAHIGKIPIVMISPSVGSLISESGEERRRFANTVLSQMDPTYLAGMMQYNKYLQQRNRMLKDGISDPDLFAVTDHKLAELARPLYEARLRLAEELQPVVSAYYATVSGGAETVEIAYRSDLAKGDLATLLSETIERDRILHFTGCGLQRDEFVFTMNGHPIRRAGSQGQQKSFLVALKFAQYEIMKRRYGGVPPILILDDAFDKLDMTRIANLIAMVAGNDFGQIFISDSNKVRLSLIVDKITDECRYYVAEAGSFRPLDVNRDGTDLPR